MERTRPPLIHVVLMDGTFASLAEGQRSSIGQIHALLCGRRGPVPGPRLRLRYTAGQQWDHWRTLGDLAMGRSLETWISEAYGWLASGYEPGDTVFLLGYSRGAFAVRSLAGMIGRVGLLKPVAATERNIRLAWRYYRQTDMSDEAALFRRRRCHAQAPVRMVGCFDTVMALGLRLPLLWMLTEPQFRFHDASLGAGVEYGYQALALDETRAIFAPQLWDDTSRAGHIEQMWFTGSHPDIGGQLSGLEFVRPLANIPLVWMLERAQAVGLPLPDGWRDHFPCDVRAPSMGTWRNWGKLFLARAPRMAGRNPTEALHGTVPLPYPGPALLTGHLADAAAPRARLIPRLNAGTQGPSDQNTPAAG
ncbi:MAG: DUF2235 domain-containing protein [Paracoccus sp. (in: a-proteobacteria)]|nr:DUF2235 domain-containing protein [Paracoccus sp. (in: a-proteobacteria)]